MQVAIYVQLFDLIAPIKLHRYPIQVPRKDRRWYCARKEEAVIVILEEESKEGGQTFCEGGW